MKGLIDMDDEEVFMEKGKKKPQKSHDEIFKEEQYEKRCQFVRLSKSSDFHTFVDFLKANERYFVKMERADKECMRRTCQRIMDRTDDWGIDDLEYFNRIFGLYIDPRASKTIPESPSMERKDRVLSLEEEIAYRSKGSYYAMWDFITSPVWQDRLKGRDDLYDKVKSMIERAKKENIAISENFKRYEPEDEKMYEKVLEMMKNEQND